MDLRTRIASALKEVRGRGQRLVQLNVELLTAELKAKGAKYAAAVGLFLAAGLLALYALGFALATVAVALHLVMPLWLALLIVTVMLIVLIVVFVLVGRSSLLRAGSPTPDKAIAEARASITAAKAQLRRSGRAIRQAGAGAETVLPGQSPPHTPARQATPQPGEGTREEAPGPATNVSAGPAREEGRRL